MCGIFGTYSPDGARRESLELMGRLISHRGPDDVGIHIDGPVGVGNRRLSIIDLEHGHQPISNADDSTWIVFNGEIYNYREIRKVLVGRGHKFKTHSDTEVILRLYEEKGIQCVKDLEGMFTFAIWDSCRRRLFLARDKLGQKPLYYSYRDGVFLFASEIKSVLSALPVAVQPNPVSMHHYLSLRFVPLPNTMFDGIHKLSAAHTLILQNDKISMERYWKISYTPKLKLGVRESIEALDEKLGDAVERTLVADVQVGALLSGGLDSGLVTALASIRSGAKVSTFSVGVAEDDWSELPAARAVAAKYDTDHHELVVNPNPTEILPRLIWHLDEPSDPSAACKYFVAQEAARYVKVVLGGDGGDEMLGGYDRYAGNRFIRYYCLLPKVLRRQITKAMVSRVPESFTYKSVASKFRWLDQMVSATEDRRYAASVNFFRFDDTAKRALYTREFDAEVTEHDSIGYIASVFNEAPVDDLIDKMLYTDVMTQMAEHGLMIVDRTTMSFGLESRSPFLDSELVEFCASLPTNLKVRNHRLRYIQRELARKYLPSQVVALRKQGFGLPLGYWFKSELGDYAEEMFRNSTLTEAGYMNAHGMLDVLDQHRNKGVDHSHRLWMLLNLEIWHRMFFTKNGPDLGMERIRETVFA